MRQNTTTMETQVITPDAVTKIVATLAPEQLRTVYEFALFLQFQGGAVADDDDVAWMRHLTASDTSEYAALRKQAIADIDAGLTTPMFDDVGEMVTE